MVVRAHNKIPSVRQRGFCYSRTKKYLVFQIFFRYSFYAPAGLSIATFQTSCRHKSGIAAITNAFPNNRTPTPFLSRPDSRESAEPLPCQIRNPFRSPFSYQTPTRGSTPTFQVFRHHKFHIPAITDAPPNNSPTAPFLSRLDSRESAELPAR